ncbi:DUF3566 domain-containing protein [Planotetraspora thailandica]|uniref:DUF3566 domain-containing protein n=1 Tax=Planotetraspora thailandica TaxID=487172 RepID=UPI0035EA6EA6
MAPEKEKVTPVDSVVSESDNATVRIRTSGSDQPWKPQTAKDAEKPADGKTPPFGNPGSSSGGTSPSGKDPIKAEPSVSGAGKPGTGKPGASSTGKAASVSGGAGKPAAGSGGPGKPAGSGGVGGAGRPAGSGEPTATFPRAAATGDASSSSSGAGRTPGSASGPGAAPSGSFGAGSAGRGPVSGSSVSGGSVSGSAAASPIRLGGDDTGYAASGNRFDSLTGAPKGKGKKGDGKGPRRAHLVLRRVEPWSAMKFSFVVSLVCFVVLFVAVAILYFVLSSIGVFSSITSAVSSLTSGDTQTASTLDISGWFDPARILGFTGLLGAVNVVLITALSTLGAVIYNVAADLVGGVEVTFSEAE